jgi:hypothetical protein
MLPEIVTSFVDASLKQLYDGDMMRRPDPKMPEVMRDFSRPVSNDWLPWKPIPSTVLDSDLDEMEKEIGLRFPPLYRNFLQYLHFYDLASCVQWEPHVVNQWKKQLRQVYKGWYPERILGKGLIPFGSEPFMDAGPACFDTGQRLPDGDCPIVFWDHEWVGTKKEICPMFSSMAKMLECLKFEAQAEIRFIYHDESDKSEDLPKKKHLLSEFLSLDPIGAGGIARNYWTCWGVKPDN